MSDHGATSQPLLGDMKAAPTAMAARRWSTSSLVMAIAAINAVLVLWLVLIGRNVLPQSGALEIWSGDLGPGQNSQHMADWYSLLHGVFGMGLFLFVDWLKPVWPTDRKLVVAVAGSALWEAIENTPIVIALFVDPRQPNAYAGDSVVNSLGDMVFVVIGFFVASRLPVWASVLLAVAIEVVVSMTIDDGLVLGTLRVLGLPV